jgi:Carboxypeptidase regulatory-like domain
MVSILQHIGTSLQLVALFLLLIAGIAHLLVRTGKWSPSPAITKLVINRLFEAGIAALFIGVAGPAVAPVLDRWLNGDETFHGAVLSKSGDPIPNATVNLITIGTVATNAVGMFDITVPRNRILSEYKVQVKAPGYETLPVSTKTPAEMKNIEIRLNPVTQELIKALESPLMVGHFYGVPFVVVTLRIENTGPTTIPITDVRAQLLSNDDSFILSPASWTILNPFGPFAAVTGPFPIFAGATLDLRIVMMTSANFSTLWGRIAALPEYRSQLPCVQKLNGTVDPMTDNAFDIVRNFADEHFSWRNGEWNLRLEVISDNEAKTFQRSFTLSDTDTKHLHDSIALLKQCMAVNIAAPLAQDGSLSNFITK